MKKILITISAIALLSSCADNETQTTKRTGEPQCRIIGKEYTVYNGYGYQILEIDGKEYLSTTRGGICPLVKDSVKINEN